MKPIIRAVLFSWYGFDLNLTESEVKSLYTNSNEVCFLTACLIDDTASDKIPPKWLSEELLSEVVENYWEVSGKYIFQNVFGISFRNKNQNKLYEKLSDYLDIIIWKKISNPNYSSDKLIKSFSFPDEYISFFNWLHIKKRDLTKISDSNCAIVTSHFIDELFEIYKKTPFYLNKENNYNPFQSFQLHEDKYLTTLAYLSLFLLSSNETDIKKFKNLCFEYKLLFYGNFDSVYIANQFAELILLIFLSVYRINDIDLEGQINLEKFLEIISDSILIPYLHLLERENEVWSKEKSTDSYLYKRGHLVLNHMKYIQNSNFKDSFNYFFQTINEVVVINWNEIVEKS